MPEAAEWKDKLTRRVLSLFSQKEVKTPLSFFFRLSGAIVVIVLASIYAVGPDSATRFQIFLIGIGCILVLFVGVMFFAWCRPKHLVYGETGHRAESKFTLGTEKKEISASELSSLEGTANTVALTSGEQK